MNTVFAAGAACLALTTGLVRPAGGTVPTAPCEFVSAGDSDAPAAVSRYPTPGPVTATAFTSPDGFGGRQYLLALSNGTCAAHSGLDADFDQRVTLPGQRGPAFEQVFGAGGDYQLPYGCRYLPSIRRFAYPNTPPDCAAPPSTDHIAPLDTGMATLPAALVRVEPDHTDEQLRTTGTDPVLALVLAFDLGNRVVMTSYADCRLAPATAAVCSTSLQIFAGEAIAFHRDAAGFRVTGDPGARIRAAIRAS